MARRCALPAFRPFLGVTSDQSPTTLLPPAPRINHTAHDAHGWTMSTWANA